jgi:hypothetical protein
VAGPREGVRGKLTGDPAVQSAAVALLAGVADPLGFLALSPDDNRVMVAVVNEAVRIRDEHERALLDYVARATSGQTIAGIASVVRSALKALRPRK